MNRVPDDVLRDALRSDAGGAHPDPAVWEAVRAEAERRRARTTLARRAGLAAAAAAAAVGVAVTVASLRGGPDTTGIDVGPAREPGAAMPAEIVATVGGDLVVLDARDGSVTRTLWTDADREAVDVTATPDGHEILSTRTLPPEACARGGTEIVGTDAAGTDAPVTWVVGAGARPVLSLDGRFLAYGPSGCGEAEPWYFVIDRATGAQYRGDIPAGVATVATGVAPLAFEPGTGRLLLRVEANDGEPRAYLVDPASWGGQRGAGAGSGEAFTPVTFPAGARAAAFLPGGSLVTERRAGPDDEIVIADPATGAVVDPLFALPTGWAVDRFSVDPTGEHLLLAAVQGDGMGRLFRWAAGDAEATLVTDDPALVGAAWLPAPAPDRDPSRPLAPGMPDTAAVLGDDGRLVALRLQPPGARTPTIVRELDGRAAPRAGSVSVGAGTVYYERAGECGDDVFLDGVIMRVPLAGGEPERVAAGRWPSVSADGRRLAYVTAAGPGCGGEGVLAVRDLETGAVRTWPAPRADDGGPVPEIAGPMSWHPDGAHLLVAVNREPATDWWAIDTRVAGTEFSGVRVPFTGEEQPRGLRYLGGGRVAAIAGVDGVVVGVDPATGEPDGTVYAAPHQVGGPAVAFTPDAAGRFLLVVAGPDGNLTAGQAGGSGRFWPQGGSVVAAAW